MPLDDTLLALEGLTTNQLYEWKDEIIDISGKPFTAIIDCIDWELTNRGLPLSDPALDIPF